MYEEKQACMAIIQLKLLLYDTCHYNTNKIQWRDTASSLLTVAFILLSGPTK